MDLWKKKLREKGRKQKKNGPHKDFQTPNKKKKANSENVRTHQWNWEKMGRFMSRPFYVLCVCGRRGPALNDNFLNSLHPPMYTHIYHWGTDEYAQQSEIDYRLNFYSF